MLKSNHDFDLSFSSSQRKTIHVQNGAMRSQRCERTLNTPWFSLSSVMLFKILSIIIQPYCMLKYTLMYSHA